MGEFVSTPPHPQGSALDAGRTSLSGELAPLGSMGGLASGRTSLNGAPSGRISLPGIRLSLNGGRSSKVNIETKAPMTEAAMNP